MCIANNRNLCVCVCLCINFWFIWAYKGHTGNPQEGKTEAPQSFRFRNNCRPCPSRGHASPSPLRIERNTYNNPVKILFVSIVESLFGCFRFLWLQLWQVNQTQIDLERSSPSSRKLISYAVYSGGLRSTYIHISPLTPIYPIHPSIRCSFFIHSLDQMTQ